MADHGRPDPEEPGDASGPGPVPGDPQGPEARDPRDPVALAAWRRVAAQRGRRAPLGAAPDDVEDGGAERSEPATVEVPAPAVGGGAAVGHGVGHGAGHAAGNGAGNGAGGRWTASRPPPGFAGDPRASRPARADGPYGAPPEHGGRPSAGSLHDALLGMAGRIDDDALSWVRELVAIEDDAGAAELLSGCLLADAVAVSATERAVLAPWFSATRVDPELLELLPVDDAARERHGHRFVADVRAEARPDGPRAVDGEGVDAVARAAGRLPGVVAVVQCWRVTPAGASSGPLPHRVLLVTTDAGVDSEHVAHHVAYAARELGAVSVEVLTAGADLPAYHRDALGAAVPVLAAAAAPAASTTSAAPGAGVAPPAPRPADGAGDEVSEADMLLAELPYSPADTEPGDAPLAQPDRSTDVGELDPDEAAARIAALWSTPAPLDGSPAEEAAADGPSGLPADQMSPTEVPAADVPAAEVPADELPADGVVPRGRTSRDARADRPDADAAAAGPVRVNGHHHGVNGARHDDLGLPADGPSAVEPPTDPVGWPFVTDDAPAVDGVVNGWHDDPAPTGPTGPTPIATPDAGRAGTEDSLPELSDRERELLARLHAELAAREAQAPDPAPPTTPLPTPEGEGPVNGQGLPPRITDDRGDGPADRA